MAKAKTAFRKKHAAVITVTASTSGITTGPCTTRKDFPRSTRAFRSSMASHIDIAGSTWTRVSRQLVTSSFTPSNSITNAPTPRASGANSRRDRLSWRIACSTAASSLSRTARINLPALARRAAGRGRDAGGHRFPAVENRQGHHRQRARPPAVPVRSRLWPLRALREQCCDAIPSAGQAVTRRPARRHRPYPGFVPGRVAPPPGALVCRRPEMRGRRASGR